MHSSSIISLLLHYFIGDKVHLKISKILRCRTKKEDMAPKKVASLNQEELAGPRSKDFLISPLMFYNHPSLWFRRQDLAYTTVSLCVIFRCH